jgi:hypothetical protein
MHCSWALDVMNPHAVPLSADEVGLFDALFAAFLKRQGFSGGSAAVIPRAFLHGWATHEFLHDAAPRLNVKRQAVAAKRRELVEAERVADQQAAAAARRADERFASLGITSGGGGSSSNQPATAAPARTATDSGPSRGTDENVFSPAAQAEAAAQPAVPPPGSESQSEPNEREHAAHTGTGGSGHRLEL